MDPRIPACHWQVAKQCLGALQWPSQHVLVCIYTALLSSVRTKGNYARHRRISALTCKPLDPAGSLRHLCPLTPGQLGRFEKAGSRFICSGGDHTHSLSSSRDGMRCIDGLTKALATQLSPRAFTQGTREDDEQELVYLATSADRAISKSSEFKAAIQDLTQLNVQGVACDTSQSLLHKEDALKRAGEGDFVLAARQFTRNLACIDEIRHPRDASTCLTNRALCLLQLQQHSNVADDCLAALKFHQSVARAHFLRAIALERLQQYTEAEKHAHCAASAARAERLPISAAHDAARLLADIQTFANGTAARPQSQASATDAIRSEQCISMPTLEARDTASEGRTLCMGRREGARAGDILMQEDACAAVVMKQHRNAMCHHCFKALALEAAYPCKQCQLAWYCSSAHRDADSCHRSGSPSCGVPWTALLPERAVLATRLALISKEHPELRTLEHHIRDVPWAQLMEECVVCCLAAACAALAPWEVLRAYRQVCVNAVAVVPALHSGPSLWLGLAVYPRAAMLNHACLPNVSASFRGLQLQLHALEALPASTTLRLSYGPQVGESITAVRQLQLLGQYHFRCSCLACSQGPCSAADARLVGLRCAGCAGPVVPSMACNAGVCSLQGLPARLVGAGRCNQCGREMADAEQNARLAALSKAGRAYRAACNLLSEGAHRKATRLCQSCLRVQAAELVATNQTLGRSHATLAEALAEQGCTAEAAAHAGAALQCVRSAYGASSQIAVHEERKWLRLGLPTV